MLYAAGHMVNNLHFTLNFSISLSQLIGFPLIFSLINIIYFNQCYYLIICGDTVITTIFLHLPF